MRGRWFVWAALACVLAGSTALLFRTAPPPEPTGGAVRVLRGGTEVEVSGPLAPGLAGPLRQALAQGARLVQLDSIGGTAQAAEAIAAEVRAAGADTAVTDRCLSACVPVFLAGRRRWISPFSQYGLEARHGGVSLLGLYRDAGVPASLLSDVGATPDGEGWFPTATDLLANGMATGMAAADQFALAGFGPAPTDDIIRARLLSVPLYRAAALADPEGFDLDFMVWRDSVLRGEPGTQAFSRTRSTIRRLVNQSLQTAPDDLLLDYAHMLTADISWMEQHQPDQCGDLSWKGLTEVSTRDGSAGRRAELDLRFLQALIAGSRQRAAPQAPSHKSATGCNALRQELMDARNDPLSLRLLMLRVQIAIASSPQQAP